MTNVLRKRALIARTLAESANQNDDLRDLYVFGYQCRLFRDDERALFIDSGKHLIPWMGNESLMIDRYDGRGHLHDLSAFDSELVPARVLSEEERHIEALCDEERYLELNSDILEKMLYEEEELKRLNEALADDNSYSAVSFDYNSSNKTEEPSAAEASHGAENDETRPYVPIAALQLPPHITLPHTEKMHAIIERTAVFIAKHGVQMEIMMKTKQKDNTQFCFLNYEDELNAYYKHVLHAIKHLKYTPASAAQQTSADVSEETYLHPDLSSSSSLSEKNQQPRHFSRKEFLESVSAKLPVGQIANTQYAKLLSNLSKHTRTHSPKPVEHADRSDTAGEKSAPTVRSAPSLQNVNSSSVSELPQSSSRSGTHVSSLPPVPGLEPVSLPVSSQSSGVSLSSSGHDSRSTADAMPSSHIVPPPPDAKLIIDKMADYVARNGPEFEIIVRRRNDERFRFVEADHRYHAYYLHKKDAFLQDMARKKASEAQEREAQESAENVNDESTVAAEKTETVDDKNDKTQSRAVSFTIKTKEEDAPVLKTATALQCESTDDEDDDDDDDDDDDVDGDQSDEGSRQSAVKPVTNATSKVSGTAQPSASAMTTSMSRSASSASLRTAASLRSADAAKSPAPTDTRKHADRVADKLSTTARDKLASVSHSRQLQEQRKRKAAAFITRMKQSDAGETAEETATECASNIGSIAASPSMSPASVFSVRSRSRSVTPAVQPASVASPTVSSPAVELITDSPVLMSSPQIPSPGPTQAKRRKHRSRSPRHHHHRSKSPTHRHRSSSSKKHHHKKKKKKLPNAYTEIRPVSKCPRRKRSQSPTSVKSKIVLDNGAQHKSSRHGGTSKSETKLPVPSSSKKRHLSSKGSSRHHRSKKHRKTKKSHYRSSSPYTASGSPTPAKHDQLPSDSLIDLTLGDKHDRSSSDDDSSQLSPTTSEHSKLDKPPSHLSEVQTLIEEKRRQLLKEDVVVLD